MARIRDRTEDFKDAVHSVARSMGYSESNLAALMASFIMHKSLQRSPFMQAALKTLESIEALNHFIVKHRKDYVDLHRTTEQERDSIEHEVKATFAIGSEGAKCDWNLHTDGSIISLFRATLATWACVVS